MDGDRNLLLTFWLIMGVSWAFLPSTLAAIHAHAIPTAWLGCLIGVMVVAQALCAGAILNNRMRRWAWCAVGSIVVQVLWAGFNVFVLWRL